MFWYNIYLKDNLIYMQETPQNPSGASHQEQGKGKNIGMAVIAYILFFIPLLTDAKNDPFVKYHVKQGLVLFITSLIAMAISWLPMVYMFSWVLHVGLFVLFIIGVMNAVGGKENPLPLIGHLADKIHI